MKLIKINMIKNNKYPNGFSTMFSFLFGDGVAAFVMSKVDSGDNAVKIGKNYSRSKF